HISLKTVPIPAGDQFALFPSLRMGMAGASVALDDPMGDPFANPARGARLQGLELFLTPTFYGSSDDVSGGRSLPLSASMGGERWFGAASMALQQLSDRRLGAWAPLTPEQRDEIFPDGAHDNLYAFGSLGRRVPGAEHVAVGVSGFWADLGALDGVQRLYMRSSGIRQSGTLDEYRVGAMADLGDGATLDAVALRSSLDMTHRVLYVEWDQWGQPTTTTTRTEINLDRTVTWGAQLRYTRPLAAQDWRAGAVLTGNRKSHPKIPNYDLVNIPRDPGSSRVFQVGGGLAKVTESSAFTVEAVLEPGRSHTWAYTDTALTTEAGTVIPAGGRTVDNRFVFRNVAMATAVQKDYTRAGFQLGLRLRSIRYTLDQKNFLADTVRHTREGWMEWTPTWSGVLRFDDFDLRYAGRATMKGWVQVGGVFPGVRFDDAAAAPGGGDFLVAPTQPVDMPDFRVTTHQFTISVPVR
ncbi:MAG TPA: hypothetical protein VMK65_02080, partial [Longimicrobiales bacterium]|nr:hypothetical protein [Longimicrobiales bacterium]